MCPDNARLEYSLFSTAERCLLSRVGEIKLGDIHNMTSLFYLSLFFTSQSVFRVLWEWCKITQRGVQWK